MIILENMRDVTQSFVTTRIRQQNYFIKQQQSTSNVLLHF